MPKEVIMPALGMAQDEGVLLRWLKREGEMVQAGEPLMEVATDKVDVQVEAPASGLLTAVTAREGDEIPVGQVIGLIAAEGEELPDPAAAEQADEPVVSPSSESRASHEREASVGARGGALLSMSPVAARMAAEHGIDPAEVPAVGGRVSKEDVEAHIRSVGSGESNESQVRGGCGRDSSDRTLASPKARRLARERGIELASLVGSGPEGAVLAADVPLTAQPQPAPTELVAPDREPDRQAVSRMWQIMAQRLTESWTSAPHFYLVREVDAAQLMSWRDLRTAGERTAGLRAGERREKGQGCGRKGSSLTPHSSSLTPLKITYTDLLTKLAALSLARFPRLNSFWQDGAIVTNPDISVGLAIAVEEGLLVPVVHNADRLPVADIAARRADLVARANSGGLAPHDFAGGTFTISNLGMYGVDAFNAIVNPPQAAILAVGRIADRVVAVEGQPAVRPMMTLTLSCDHRAVDGVRAAQFLDALAGLIEEPLRAL